MLNARLVAPKNHRNANVKTSTNQWWLSYQNAQAGGVEGGREIDDPAPGGVNRERGDGHVGGPAEQVPHQSGPAPRPAQGAVLPVSHDVQVKGKAHVFCQLLQQVNAVPIAAFPQVVF